MPTKILIIVIFTMLCIVNTNLYSQVKTEETRRSIDSTTGEVTIIKSEIISKSEDITPISNILTINPLKFFLFYNLSYYSKVSPVSVIGAGLQMPTLADIFGGGINIEYRFHPSKKAPRGFYVAPNISYNYFKTDNVTPDSETESKSATIFSAGLLLGWQWFPSEDFAIGLGIGVDRYFTSKESKFFDEYNGVIPAVRFDIGYSW